MTDAIAHRGPDGEGHWLEGNVGLGHRRLAVIDPSPSGCQPMMSTDGRWVLTYNGEVYNYRELMVELNALGYAFRSRSDTEVVLTALVAWGVRGLLRLNGMFALALWDRKEGALLLARDRYGIKPLYYSTQGGRFVFASESKAIVTHPRFRTAVDRAAIVEYFTFQNILTDRTLLQDVELLPAGHWMRVLADSPGTPQRHRYWDFRFEESPSGADEREWVEELARLFHQAVQRHLVSDVEVGSYLSGGIDSGSIAAVAAQSVANVKTFTCGFDLSSASGMELAFDERAKAERMSGLFKTEHYEMVLKAGDMERCMPALAWHLEEPRIGQSYPNYYAAHLASRFVKVVLSGAGGDELFGGYPWRYFKAASSSGFDEFVRRYYAYWQRLLSDDELRQLLQPIWHEVRDVSTPEIFENVFASHDSDLERPEDFVNHSLYFEAKTFLHGLFLVEDKLSLAHGLEARVPFMDNDLVDFAMRMPVRLKVANLNESMRFDENAPGHKSADYTARTGDGKRALRAMAAKLLPPEIHKGPKQGFSAPDASWFKGESIDYVRRVISDPRQPLFDYLSQPAAQALVESHLSGERNRRLLIWSLLSASAYLRSMA